MRAHCNPWQSMVKHIDINCNDKKAKKASCKLEKDPIGGVQMIFKELNNPIQFLFYSNWK